MKGLQKDNDIFSTYFDGDFSATPIIIVVIVFTVDE
jgi:hypothetical protein